MSDQRPLAPARFEQTEFNAAHQLRDGSLFGLANGLVGVRGDVEELADESCTFLTGYKVTVPLKYHERFTGFADATDIRPRGPNVLWIELAIDGQKIDFGQLIPSRFGRKLDLASGLLLRETVWALGDGRQIEIESRRMVPDGGAVVLSELTFRPLNFDAQLSVDLEIRSGAVQRETDDPRISGMNAARLNTISARADEWTASFVQCGGKADPFIAAIQRLSAGAGAEVRPARIGAAQQVKARVAPDQPLTIRRVVAMAHSDAGASSAEQVAHDLALTASQSHFDSQLASQTKMLETLWTGAAISISDNPELAQAIGFNFFTVLQSASRNGEAGTAAKGLTGDGYEGHVFWDTEAFVLPVLSLTNPDLARNGLTFRVRQLDRALAQP